MLEDHHLYLLPAQESGISVLDKLAEVGYAAFSAGKESSALTFFDTRSGAFFRTRIRLCHVPSKSSWQWWKDGRRLQEDPGEPTMVPFATAPDVVRDHLKVGERLLPQLAVQLRKKTLRMLAPSGESVLLAFIQTSFSNPHRPRWKKGPEIVHVSPAGASSKEVDYLGSFLRNWVQMVPIPGDLLEVGLGCLGLPLPGAPVPSHLQLLPADSMGEACRKIVARQAFKIWANTDGALLDLDPEFVHDLRVATRRARFALRLFREIIGDETAAKLRAELRWLAQACGDVRDLDVMTETLRTRMELGGPGEVTDPWMRSLAQKREVALAEMVKALRSERFAALMAQIDSLPTENPTVGEADRRPVSEMAPSWIVNVIRKVLRWQTTDGRDLEPLELHRLRIAFKGARYTCEFFREVLDLDEVDRVLDLFVEYQDCLGKFQDACVAIERLVKLARERWSDEDKRLEEFLFIGGVIGAHRDLADRQRADFHTRWPSFPSKIRRFRRMMRRKAGGSLVPSVQTPPPETPPVSMES